MTQSKGTLYVVATPIGNLNDMTHRAVEILSRVHCIAAEDTRHSRPLLKKYAISTPCVSYHDFNEHKRVHELISQMLEGYSIALISDAGTPNICDPGYLIVKEARHHHIKTVAIPGACAFVTLLSMSGLPTDRFVFEGFLPAKQGQRLRRLEALCYESRSLIFYESPHRILSTLEDMKVVFGADRKALMGRELTKIYETVFYEPLQQLHARVGADANQRRGEIVLVINGIEAEKKQVLTPAIEQMLKVLLKSGQSVKQASTLVADIANLSRKLLYDAAVLIRTNDLDHLNEK